jgi:hypothetical protein
MVPLRPSPSGALTTAWDHGVSQGAARSRILLVNGSRAVIPASERKSYSTRGATCGDTVLDGRAICALGRSCSISCDQLGAAVLTSLLETMHPEGHPEHQMLLNLSTCPLTDLLRRNCWPSAISFKQVEQGSRLLESPLRIAVNYDLFVGHRLYLRASTAPCAEPELGSYDHRCYLNLH